MVQQIYDELKPYQMKVQLTEDYSESDFDSNTIKRYKVSGTGDNRKLERYDVFNFTNGSKYDYDNGHFKQEDEEYYNLIDEGGDEYHIMAKNKKTGSVIEDRLNKMQSDMDSKLDSFFGKK